MYDIEYYTEKGKCPVLEFIQARSPKEQAKILREIDLLEEFGLALGMPHIRKMHGTEDIWELRIKHSTNNFRIFYFCFTGGTFILLHGIRKTTGKTPVKDLNLAAKRMANYLKGSD
ncbi:type II toxin-antitoxin system RelE/ParE family toxin [Phosphitispora fastidiosa]|uniref:type II toxin-antitoxin system RelE/ParE family toxin n=1 Tax=Phosphitispora fastidiosa TaxID=2837202 RepID=UPI001E356BE3|nr:type II toxin-antitoxin system RelE/ParE family toxin [Phosphitispora fastidiosa]MBU7008889.1 phage-related protein [Phosphitispora fastidiosa]